jgi:hypothetical protein
MVALMRIRALVAVVAVAGALVTVPAAPAGADVPADPYWTDERMASAKPYDVVDPDLPAGVADPGPDGPAVSVPPATAAVPAQRAGTRRPSFTWAGPATAPPATTSGRVFFVPTSGPFQGRPMTCSGSAVNSEGKSMVVTAGHCVHDGAGGSWHSHWVFVPGYRSGARPFGTWSARILDTTGGWFFRSDFRSDFGIAIVNSTKLGLRLVDVVGGQGFAWNQPWPQFYWEFAYPVEPPYTGATLEVCANPSWNDPLSPLGGILGQDCDLTGGASGGPRLMLFDGTFGYLNSVDSFGRSWLPGRVYGPYFDSEEGGLYNRYRLVS